MLVENSPTVAENQDVSLQVPYDRTKSTRVPRENDSVTYTYSLLKQTESTTPPSTEHVLVFASLAALFYRYTSQQNIPFLVSLFWHDRAVNNLALDLNISGDTEFATIESSIREMLDQDAAAASTQTPVTISYTDCQMGGETRESDPMDCAPCVVESASSDLDFQFVQYIDRVDVRVDFDRQLFERSTIERIAAQLAQIMSVASANPSVKVSEIEFMSDAEIAELNRACTGVVQNLPDEPVYKEIERLAISHADCVAIEFKSTRITYFEANKRANQIASYLLKLGVESGSRVVVCMAPCADVPIVLLALFKIGAVYVPLNPQYPTARKSAILDDTDPVMIVSHSEVATNSDFGARRAAVLELHESQISVQSAQNPALDVRLDQIASIYYTSGTTGLPKGVTGTHGNLVHLVHGARERFGFSDKEVLPAVASFSFSISMFELMAPLTVGGTLRILEREVVLDAMAMSQVLLDVTAFHIGPALLKNIVKYVKDDRSASTSYAHVRHVSTGGDMVPPELLNDVRRLFPRAEVFDLYGCSEISIMGCNFELPDIDIERTYVGGPCSNVTLLVLDDDGNQVPFGAVGDVCFGGPGIVPGYLNRPELVASAFFERDGVTFYRTGDRGRLTPDGNLELLGRRDFQVQIRGMRVEIGEIEYYLRQAPGVQDGVVAASRTSSGETGLTAYCVAKPDCKEDSELVRRYMLQQVPDFMVPAHYAWMQELPLNQNLKIDRKALPKHVPRQHTTNAVVNPPKSATEKTLAKIWSDILGIGSVGLDDNFLLLGGDSALAMEMIFIVHKRLGVRIEGMDVLRESLQVLAAICDGSGVAKVDSETTKKAPANLLRNIVPVESFYFGPADSLYGIYSPPKNSSSREPVLICGPIAHESVRCVFLLKVLANSLSECGVPVLRFDYFGTGDSAGDSREASWQRWNNDIQSAAAKLRDLTGAKRVRVLGIRMGATLASVSLAAGDVGRFIIWDPVVDGAAHIAQQRKMHGEQVEKLLRIRRLRKPAAISGCEELVGFTYRNELVQETESISWGTGAASRLTPSSVLVSKNAGGAELCRNSAAAGVDCKGELIQLDVDCGWYQTSRATAAITNQNILSILRDELLDNSHD